MSAMNESMRCYVLAWGIRDGFPEALHGVCEIAKSQPEAMNCKEGWEGGRAQAKAQRQEGASWK